MGMFDRTIREIEKLARGQRISVSIQVDDDGFIDRECPSLNCGQQFKVHADDWKVTDRDVEVFCPFCRSTADVGQWNTPEQREYMRKAAHAHAHKAIGQALAADARSFRFGGPGSFVRIKMTYRPGTPILAVTPEVAAVMQQQFTCDGCGCRFASIGASFFCPACGHDSAEKAFDSTIATVRRLIEKLPHLQAGFGDADLAADATRDIVENSVGRLVTAFQKFVAVVFQKLPNAPTVKVPKNVFQRIDDGSNLWATQAGKGYATILTPTELSELKRLFQQRHVLEHRDGIVDSDYLTKSGDGTYVAGQRLVIRPDTVLRLAELVEKLAHGLR